MKRKVINFILFLIILSLVVYVLRDIDLMEIFNLVRNINPWLLALAFLLIFLAYVSGIIRWKISLSTLKKVKLKHLFVLHFAGLFINTITPGAQTGGEPVRAYYLGRLYKSDTTKFFGATLADKTFNLIAIFSIVAFSVLTLFIFASIPTSLKIFFQTLIVSVILLVVLSSFIYMKKYHLNIIEYVVRITHKNFMKERFKKLSEFKEYLEKRRKYFIKEYKKVLLNKRILITGILLSYINWILVFLASFVLFYAFENPVSYLSILIVVSISEIVGNLSPLPGGIGVTETTMFLLYSLFSISSPVALSVAVLVKAIHYFYALVIGSLALNYARKNY